MWNLRVWLSWYLGKQAPASPSRAWNWIGRISKRGKKWKGRWGWEISTSTSYWEKNIKRRGGKLTWKTHDPHEVKGFKEEGYTVARVPLQLFFLLFSVKFRFQLWNSHRRGPLPLVSFLLMNVLPLSCLQLVTATIKAQLPVLITIQSFPSRVMTEASVLAWKTLLETSATAAVTPIGTWAQVLAVSSVCVVPLVL